MGRSHRPSYRPQLEGLEARAVPTTVIGQTLVQPGPVGIAEQRPLDAGIVHQAGHNSSASAHAISTDYVGRLLASRVKRHMHSWRSGLNYEMLSSVSVHIEAYDAHQRILRGTVNVNYTTRFLGIFPAVSHHAGITFSIHLNTKSVTLGRAEHHAKIASLVQIGLEEFARNPPARAGL